MASELVTGEDWDVLKVDLRSKTFTSSVQRPKYDKKIILVKLFRFFEKFGF